MNNNIQIIDSSNNSFNIVGLTSGDNAQTVRLTNNGATSKYPSLDSRVNNSSLNNNFPADINGSNRIGQRAIEYIEVEIGGQCIDKQYGDWMDIWSGLTYSGEKWQKWNRMVNATLPSNSLGNRKLYIPLQFWFCKNPGLALPLIALQYHEVKINVQFASSVSWTHQRDLNEPVGTSPISTMNSGGGNEEIGVDLNGATGPLVISGTNGASINNSTFEIMLKVGTTKTVMSIENCCVFCDYIFLDTDERRRFAQVSHEYLIEQVQYSNALSLSAVIINTISDLIIL